MMAVFRGVTTIAFGACCATLSGCATGPTLAQSQASVVTPQALPVSPDTAYQIGKGDVLAISVFDEPTLSFPEVTVDETGSIPFPLADTIPVEGLTGRAAADLIEAALRSNFYKDPRVTVFVKNSASRQLTVEGDVEKPGVFELRGDATLLQAMALAEGPTRTAKLDQVIVFRPVGDDLYAAQFDLRKVRVGAEPNVVLQSGDTVVVGFSQAKGLFRDVLQVAPVLTSAFLRVL